MKEESNFYSNIQNEIKFIIPYWTYLLLFVPLLFTLATVFIIDNSLANGVVSGKYFWFYGSMGLVSIATLIYSFTNKQSFRVSLTDVFVFLFVGSVFLPAFLSGDTSANTTKLTLLALLLILYLSLRLIPDGEGQRVQGKGQKAKGAGQKVLDRWYKTSLAFRPVPFAFFNLLCLFIIITGLIEAVWGLLQLYGFKPSQHALFKLTGSFFNPGPYAGYLAVVFPMALNYWVKGTRQKVKDKLSVTYLSPFAFRLLPQIIAAITCIAILLVLPAAMSRASWLAAIAGSVIVAIPHFSPFAFRPSPLIRRLSLILLFCLLVASFAGMYYLKKNSADGRLLTWKVSLITLSEHPFGVGLGHFPSAYGDAQAAYFASGKASETKEYVAGNPEYGFNEFLQIAIESGIVSLLLIIGILVSAFRGLITNKNWGVMGSLVALLVFACFSYPFSVLPFPIVFVFLLAMSEKGKACRGRCRLSQTIAFAMTVVTVFCLWKQYPVYRAYKQWNSNRMYYQTGMYKEASKNYEPLYPYLNDQIQFLFEYGRSLSQSGQPEKSNKVLQQATKISCDPMLYNIMGKNYQALKEYDLAEQCLLKSTHIVPNRLYPYYLLMKLYIETGDEERALETAGIVLTKEPKVQSQAVKEMREEARKLKVKN